MSYSAVSDSFEYLCYGPTAITNILLPQCGNRLESSESDVYRRQILTTKLYPRAARVEIGLVLFPILCRLTHLHAQHGQRSEDEIDLK